MASTVGVALAKGTTIITMTGVGVATETFIIGDETYTFRAVPGAEARAVDIGTDETTQAVAMVAAINASGAAGLFGTATVANKFVKATSALGVVTLTARLPGTQINGVAMEMSATNGTNITAGTNFAATASAVAGTGDIHAFIAAARTGLLDPKSKTRSALDELGA